MFWEIIIKTAMVHTLTYFIVGFSAFKVFNYKATLSHASSNMRPATDILVRAGVLFQPIRGVFFGIILFLLRDILIVQSNGWLITWLMFVIVGILGTFAPAASSFEGLIYLKPGIGTNWGGLLEILTQSFLLSVITFIWINYPNMLWLNWVLGISFLLSLLLPILGLLVNQKNVSSDIKE
ncbi:MAG: hypothetical protein K9J13_00905 [Saprospiraceae bacterium]|nr:hypothetical protein [Saprospiraceae bacterium]